MSKITVVILSLIIILVNFIYFPANILSWDVFGYYLYLPMTFVYRDLGMHDISVVNNIIEKYHNTATLYQALQMPDGNWVMKYSMGMAVLYSPFFFIGHLVALLFQYPADGFSEPYQYSLWLGCVAITILGIFVLRKTLICFFSEKITSVVLIVIVLGTNYLFHTTIYGQGAMSHNYLFTIYALLLFLTVRWHKNHQFIDMVLIAVFCALATLSRPSEFVCILIPVMWGIYDKGTFIQKIQLLLEKRKQIIICAVIMLLFGSLQIIYWKRYVGKFIYYSYGGNEGEGFEFFSPYILNVLLSFRKGWLIYTPVMMFALAGFIFLYKKHREIFWSVFVFFIVNLYIVSSWSCWWYAESSGQRALIPSYVFLSLSFGMFFQQIGFQNFFLKNCVGVIILFLISLNLFQGWQTVNGILHPSRTTKEYYFSVFGKTSVSEDDKKLLLIERSFDGVEIFSDENLHDKKILSILDFENTTEKINICDTFFYTGNHSFVLDSETIYSPAIDKKYFEITDKYYAWLKISLWVYSEVDFMENPASIVASFHHDGYAYKYKTVDLEKQSLQAGKWNKITFDYLTPEVRKKTDNLKVYVWHRGKENLFVDDLSVEVFEPKITPTIGFLSSEN